MGICNFAGRLNPRGGRAVELGEEALLLFGGKIPMLL